MMTDSLELFMAIARGMTFFDVAEEHNLSQSALSKKIKKLEEDLGVELFDRKERAAKLSAAGKVLFDDLVQLEPGFKLLKQHMRILSANRKLSCLIAFPGGCFRMRNILELFAMEHPEILFTVQEKHQDYRQSAFEALKKNEIDYVIMHEPLVPRDFYKFEFLHDDYFVAILPKNHPLAGKTSISYEELKEDKLFLNPWTKEAAAEIEEYTGVKPVNIIETSKGREDIAWYVATGRGIGLFYASDINSIKLHNVSIVRFIDIPNQPIVIAYRPRLEMSPEHLMLRKYITDELKNKKSDFVF